MISRRTFELGIASTLVDLFGLGAVKLSPLQPSRLAINVCFDKVSCMRLGTEVTVDSKSLSKLNKRIKPYEPIFGVKMFSITKKMEGKAVKELASTMNNLDEAHRTDQAQRPWAGGVRTYLVAFSSDNSPLFVCDLQSTTPTEIVFRKIWKIDEKTVRFGIESEVSNDFYHEVDSAAIGATLFSIALELLASASQLEFESIRIK